MIISPPALLRHSRFRLADSHILRHFLLAAAIATAIISCRQADKIRLYFFGFLS
jgi:hypothetical protein